jgi:hypothetical protein
VERIVVAMRIGRARQGARTLRRSSGRAA